MRTVSFNCMIHVSILVYESKVKIPNSRYFILVYFIILYYRKRGYLEAPNGNLDGDESIAGAEVVVCFLKPTVLQMIRLKLLQSPKIKHKNKIKKN